MVATRVYLDDSRVGPLFERAVTRQAERVRASARGAAGDAAEEIVRRGKQDIAEAGNFGPRWTGGLKSRVTEGGGHIRVAITHDVPYWSVFQYGKVIQGKPLLWIPLSFAGDAQGVRARDYPGMLFRVDRSSGAPLLMSPGAKGQPAQAKYFGKESVTVPKKFHLVEIAREVAHKMREFYRERFRARTR